MACGHARPTRSAASPSGPRGPTGDEPPPICVLLLPARARVVHPARPGRGPADRARASSRSSPRGCPTAPTCGCRRRSADGLAATQARRLRLPGIPRAIVIFHPLQYPLARGADRPAPGRGALVLALGPLRGRLRRLAAPARAARGPAPRRDACARAVNVVVSDALGDARARGGRRAAAGPARRRLLPGARPGRDRRRRVARPPRPPHRLGAAARGRRGHAGARAAADRRVARGRVRPRPGLPGLPRGAEPRLARPPLRRGGGAADPAAPTSASCRSSARSSTTPRLPYRILKYARLGRRTVSPDLQGVRTWERAVTVADDAGGVDRGAARAGRRARRGPDAELREWALAQTARAQNRPLWERLEALGIESGRLGSERRQQRRYAAQRAPCARDAARSPDSAG